MKRILMGISFLVVVFSVSVSFYNFLHPYKRLSQLANDITKSCIYELQCISLEEEISEKEFQVKGMMGNGIIQGVVNCNDYEDIEFYYSDGDLLINVNSLCNSWIESSWLENILENVKDTYISEQQIKEIIGKEENQDIMGKQQFTKIVGTLGKKCDSVKKVKEIMNYNLDFQKYYFKVVTDSDYDLYISIPKQKLKGRKEELEIILLDENGILKYTLYFEIDEEIVLTMPEEQLSDGTVEILISVYDIYKQIVEK